MDFNLSSRKTLSRKIAEKIFYFFLLAYLGLYILELAFNGFVLYAINLNYFFYASLISGVIFICLDQLDTTKGQLETVDHRFNLKDYIVTFIIGLLVFFLSHSTLEGTNNHTIFISLIIGVSACLIYAYYKRENKYNKKDIQNQKIDSLLNYLGTVIGICLLFFLLYTNIVPGGTISYIIQPESNNRNIIKYDSGKDIIIGTTPKGDSYRLVTTSNVDISLRIPRRFHSIETEVEYLPSTEDSPLRLGTKNVYNSTSYVQMTNFDKGIEDLPLYWQKINNGNVVLYQRNQDLEREYNEFEIRKTKLLSDLEERKNSEIQDLQAKIDSGIDGSLIDSSLYEINQKYSNAEKSIVDLLDYSPADFTPLYQSIEQFLSDESIQRSSIAAFNYPIEETFELSPLIDNRQFTTDQLIRGRFSLFVYQPQDGPFKLSLRYIDSNKHNGVDDIELRLINGSTIEASSKAEDDGVIAGAQNPSEGQELVLEKQLLIKGLYRITVESSNDIFYSNLFISTPYVVFGNEIHFAENEIYQEYSDHATIQPTIVYTNSTSIQYATAHKEGVQKITFNDQVINLDIVGEWQTFDGLSGVTKITMPRGDVKLIGNGIFSTDPENELFINKSIQTDDLSQAQVDKVDYIIAIYPRPKMLDNGWLLASASTEVPHIGFNDGKAELSLNFDSLKEDQKTMKIKEIRVVLHKEPLTIQKIIEKIKDVFH